MTLLAEDLLLLFLDDETGKLEGWAAYADTALGGALLVELATSGAVEIRTGQGPLGGDRVVTTQTADPQDELLITALGMIQEKERRSTEVVNRLAKGVRDDLCERLAARGILQRQEGRILGIFPRTTWPMADSRHEEQVRTRLHDALVRQMDPDERTAALVALLHAAGFAHRVVRDEALPARAIKQRAKEIADGNWGAAAVKDAIAASIAAISAVGAAAALAAGSS